jgi:hypothetical protein
VAAIASRFGRFLFVAAMLVTWSAAASEAPPTPKWFLEATRVAYTDLPNRSALGDWPDRLIADCAAAKVQVLFSRAHSGQDWPGPAWKSAYGPADPAMSTRDGTRHVVDLCHRHGLPG